MQGGGGGGDPMDQGYVPVHQQPYYGSSLMSHHSPPFPPGAGPDDDPYKRPRMHVSSPQEYYGAGAGAGLMGASAVDEDLRAWAQRAATGDLRGSFLFSPQQAPTSAGGAAGAGAAAMSETDAIVHRPATERPDMSIYRPIMMTGATPNSTSSIFCRDTVLNPNADHIILCMSSVIHVQMLQDEDADEELKKKFSIFDVEEGDDDRMDTGTTGPGGEVPAEAIHEFIERLFNLAHFSTECNIIALVYINRVIALTSMPLHKKNWKAVVLVALLIAQKVWDDRRIALSDFCQMCPEYTKERVRAMEHKFLELMQYRAVVTQGLYARYYFELRALFEQLLRQSRSQAARPFPLQPLRLWEARKLEMAKKTAVNLNAWAQLVSVGAAESSPCALFGSDRDRVMINVGEGTQRMAMEHRVRLSRLQYIFLTDLSPDELGGLPGMLLTLADINVTQIVICGPVGIKPLLESTHHFMRREELKIEVKEYAESALVYQGDDMGFRAMVLHPTVDKTVLGKRPLPTEDGGSAEETVKSRRPVIAYLCETAGVQGKFLVEKAKALNIPPGPLYGQLKAGHTVQLPDGRTIRPEEVVGPSTPGASSAVVGIPSTAYLPSLLNDPALKALQGGDSTRMLSCLIHFTPAHVVADEGYRQWMASFGPQTTHILAGYPEAAHRSPFRASRLNNLRLNKLDACIFPEASSYTDHSPADSCGSWGGCKVVSGDHMLRYNLVPASRAGLQASTVVPAITAEDMEALAAEEPVVAALSAVPSRPAVPDESLGQGEVVFLGTGSALPSKYRNVTGIYLRLPRGGMLLDCGEGSFHQLRSMYPRDQLRQVLKELRAVWISHSHADHHLGLMKVLQERARMARAEGPGGAPPVPLLVLAPASVLSWLREYGRLVPEAVEGVDQKQCFVDLARMTAAAQAFLSEQLGIARLTNVPVDHCKHAYAAVLDRDDGWRLVYSGDCRPSDRLVQAGKGAQVLIHEATFEDGKKDEALARKHSTVLEAVDVATRMEACSVILTHFSQRYPKFPVLPTDLKVKVCVAFDLMKVKFVDIPHASELLPTLQRLFPPEEEELDALKSTADDTG